MDFGFRPGDSVIVTGAGRGIGRATALEAARQGLTVVGWDKVPAWLEETVRLGEEEGAVVRAVQADIAQPDDVRRALAESGATPRYLVNNAGPASTTAFAFNEGLAQSLGATTDVTEAWLALGPGPGCSVVSVASIAALIGGAGWYACAKAGIAAYMRSLAVARPGGVRANTVAPGVTDTPRTAELLAGKRGRAMLGRVPLGRAATAEEMAQAILFLLSPAAAYVNGATLVVDGGQTLAV